MAPISTSAQTYPVLCMCGSSSLRRTWVMVDTSIPCPCRSWWLAQVRQTAREVEGGEERGEAGREVEGGREGEARGVNSAGLRDRGQHGLSPSHSPFSLFPLSCPAGNDLTKWSIKRWWFNGQFFDNIQAMIQSWNADHKGLRSSFKLLKPGGWQQNTPWGARARKHLACTYICPCKR